MSAHKQYRQAILEGRIKGAATNGQHREDTITGSLAVHTVNHQGTPAVLVSWQQGVYMTPEAWEQIAKDLGLNVADPAASKLSAKD